MSLSAPYLPFVFAISKNALLGVMPGPSPTRPENIATKLVTEIPVSGIAATISRIEMGRALDFVAGVEAASLAAARLAALREREPLVCVVRFGDLAFSSWSLRFSFVVVSFWVSYFLCLICDAVGSQNCQSQTRS